MSTSKYESIKIPVLKRTEYTTWRVRMLMYLEATDPSYLDRINEGPYIPKRLVSQTETVPEHYVPKVKSEYSQEEKAEILKEAKVKNILHNSLDAVMSNRVIACKTAKEIWDTLETQCQGTKAIKKNRRGLLIQAYEQFDYRNNESLTEIYDRFLALLNELSLVGKEYEAEDSNTKFLLALPEEWDLQTTVIRHKYDLDTMSLDEIYGILRTHDLEVEQRKKKRNQRSKSVALNVEASNPRHKSDKMSKGKNKAAKSDTDDSSSDTDANTDADTDDESTDSDMMEMVAMLVKGFKKMKFRRDKKQGKFQKKSFNTDREGFKKKEGKSSKLDMSKVKCYNCDGMGHFATECKKAKAGQRKALITSSKDWMDSSESEEEEVTYALMANTDEVGKSQEKVTPIFFDFDTDNISELRSFLKSLHISFRNQSLENARIINEKSELKERNDHLETELVKMLETQKECDKAKHMESIWKAKFDTLTKELENEKEKIRTWTNSGKKVQSILGDKNWKECLGYDSQQDNNKGKQKLETIEISLTTPVTFVSSSNKISNSIPETGSTSKSEIQNGIT